MGDFFQSVTAFYNSHTEISIAIAVAIAIFLFLKPKEFGKVVVAIAVIVIVVYLVMGLIDVVNKGSEKKSQATHRTDRAYTDSESNTER